MDRANVQVDGHEMDMLIDVPPGDGPHPAVLLMFHRGGFDDFTKGRLAALREAGYLACAPNFYHRCPAGYEASDCRQFLTDGSVLADIQAGADHLRSRADVDISRIFILGHCMGGRIAMIGAAKVGGFRGCVVFYGGGMFVPWGDGKEVPFDWLGEIDCPVIGFYGNKDVNPSPDDVNKIEAKLKEEGVLHEFYRYDVGHGFQNPAHEGPGTAVASKDAWAKALAFMS